MMLELSVTCQRECAYSEDVQYDARDRRADCTIYADAQDEDSEDHLKDAQDNECLWHDDHMRLR